MAQSGVSALSATASVRLARAVNKYHAYHIMYSVVGAKNPVNLHITCSDIYGV